MEITCDLPAAKGWMPGKPHSLALSRQQVPEQGITVTTVRYYSRLRNAH